MAATSISSVINPLLWKTKCESCSLCGGQRPERPVPGVGPLNAKIVVVGEAPGENEVRSLRPFTGRSGRLLWNAFAQHQIPRSDVYATNVLMCPTEQGKVVKTKDLEACRDRLWDELALHRPKVIVAMGTPAAKFFRGPEARISELSGHTEWSETWNAHIVYVYHSAAVLRSPDLYQDFAWGIQVAVDMLDEPTGPIEPEPIDYQVASKDHLWRTVYWLREARKQGRIICDLETTGLFPHGDRVLSVGLCWDPNLAYIIPNEVATDPIVAPELKQTLEECTLVGHNFKFDAHFLRAQYGIRARVGGDTMLMHYAIDERSGGEGGGFHDLKRLARKYCDAPLYAENVDTSHAASIPPDILYKYQAYDCVYTYRLERRLRRLLEKEPPSREGYPEPVELYERLLIPAANAILNMEERGVLVDVRKLMTMKSEYVDQLADTGAKAYQQLLDSGINPPPALNLVSPKQVSRILYEDAPVGFGYPPLGSTDEASIHELQREDKRAGREPNPFLETLLSYRSQKHTITTYLDGIGKRIILGNSSRLRTNFLIHGTTSGRLSSRNPNLQNIPADSGVKELFIAPNGYTLLNADYRRLEVGVLAYYSKDSNLTKDFAAEDFHWTVAQKVFPIVIGHMENAKHLQDLRSLEILCRNVSSLHDFARRQQRPSERTEDPDVLYGWMKTRLRRQAKYVSFGIMYGEGAEALSDEEKGLGVPVLDAEAYIRAWKAAYPAAIAYLDEQVVLAKKETWVESKSGRRRRFAYPLDIVRGQSNEAKNHPIQAFASDICLLSQIKLDQLLPERELGYVLLSVHDSILFQLLTESLLEAKEVIHDVMTGIVTDDPNIVFEIDMAVGHSWGECH